MSADAAAVTGIPAGVPVIAGTIDAWAEGVSGAACNQGDLMLMYGTTMFLIDTLPGRVVAQELWGTSGARQGTFALAGGMATSGAIISWLQSVCNAPDVPTMLLEAERAGVGANGVIMLPYFAGERTPIADPDARGLIAGLTITHTRGDLCRAAVEATAFGVRHNVETILRAGGTIERVVALGGGTQGRLWPQIVSDVTGLVQQVPRISVGASYGCAFLAAQAVADVTIERWNPVAYTYRPDPARHARYDALYDIYLNLYKVTASLTHNLVRLPGRSAVLQEVDACG